jgi:hypothetical protein
MTALKRCSATASSTSTLPTSSPRPGWVAAQEGQAVMSTINRNSGTHQPASTRQASTGSAQNTRPSALSAGCQQRSHTRPRAAPRRLVPQVPSARAYAVPSKAAEGVVKWCGWHGMQGVRGSNPLSSTPGQRPCSASTAHESPASGSKSAAICLCEANLVVRHAVDAGQHRRCHQWVDRFPPPGRRHQPGRARRRPDRPRIHLVSAGALAAVLA